MDRDVQDVYDVEVVGGEQALQGSHRVVALVLVVDGVELDVVEQVPQIGKLEHGHAGWLQQRADPGGENVQLGHVGQDVVADDYVGVAPLRRQLACEPAVEEAGQGGDAFLGLGHAGDVLGGLDAQDGNAR